MFLFIRIIFFFRIYIYLFYIEKEILIVVMEDDLIFGEDIVIKRGMIIGIIYGYFMDDSFIVKVDRLFLLRGYFVFFNCYVIEDNIDDKLFFLEGDFGFGVYVMENGKLFKLLGIVFVYLDL